MVNRICRKDGNYRTGRPSLASRVPVASWQILLRNNSPQIKWKNSKLQNRDVVFRGYWNFHKFNLMPSAQMWLWELTPLLSAVISLSTLQASEDGKTWITTNRKPKSSQVKTYEVWLEQWVSASPCYSSLGGGEMQKQTVRKPIDCFFFFSSLFKKRRWGFVQNLRVRTVANAV